MKRKQKTQIRGQRLRKKLARERTLAGPDNYFLTVTDKGIRLPFPTVAQIDVKHDERFGLYRTDWRTLMFVREKFGQVICKHYKNAVYFYGQLLIKEKVIKLGRYQYCKEESTDAIIVFKFDPSWV